jgi:hypothetical protein
VLSQILYKLNWTSVAYKDKISETDEDCVGFPVHIEWVWPLSEWWSKVIHITTQKYNISYVFICLLKASWVI